MRSDGLLLRQERDLVRRVHEHQDQVGAATPHRLEHRAVVRLARYHARRACENGAGDGPEGGQRRVAQLGPLPRLLVHDVPPRVPVAREPTRRGAEVHARAGLDVERAPQARGPQRARGGADVEEGHARAFRDASEHVRLSVAQTPDERGDAVDGQEPLRGPLGRLGARRARQQELEVDRVSRGTVVARLGRQLSPHHGRLAHHVVQRCFRDERDPGPGRDHEPDPQRLLACRGIRHPRRRQRLDRHVVALDDGLHVGPPRGQRDVEGVAQGDVAGPDRDRHRDGHGQARGVELGRYRDDGEVEPELAGVVADLRSPRHADVDIAVGDRLDDLREAVGRAVLCPVRRDDVGAEAVLDQRRLGRDAVRLHADLQGAQHRIVEGR